MCIKYVKIQDLKSKIFIRRGPTCFDGQPPSSGTYDVTEKEGDQCGGHQFKLTSQQEKISYFYENMKEKLWKTNAAI
jgi:hypothetical protein